MAKHLNISLGFTADTKQAKAQLQDLQGQLTKLLNTAPLSDNLNIAEAAKTASSQIAQLKAQLDGATNSAGQLDLTKFNESMKRSGKNILDYKKTLSSLGPEGSKAFASLATSIMNAEVPLKRTNAMLDEFVTTLKNSARWQISSNILHGLESAMSSAVGYAKDLNTSLNNIRIVTGANVDQMADFAKQANKAAKELSTTTTKYTDASLIYYQQGLNDKEVAERTAVTIKMANAAGVSAEKVSDQMTAVWNNFDDGTKSLEYYADVLARLGADTASSTDEITEGLEKFASVTGTIGLSYEYAASALATITATTRESASTVGTALKTLFSRIQGLKLGETLEDGTDLNKYSEALASIGVDIKDQNGELKDMDIILDEMGTKWQTLSRDEQTALAQTVAGVRQYTQMMTLMNNWDFFKDNVESAKNATGALEEQAKTYEESWKAASNRVKASLESIYQDILKDDLIIDTLDGLSAIIEGVDHLLDSLGGLPGVLTLIGSIGTKVFHKQLATEINNLGFTLKNTFTNQTKNEILNLRKDTSKALTQDSEKLKQTSEGQVLLESYKRQEKLQTFLLENSDKMTQEEIDKYKVLLDQNKALQEQNQLVGRAHDIAKARAVRQTKTFDKKYENNENVINAKNDYVNAYQEKTNLDILRGTFGRTGLYNNDSFNVGDPEKLLSLFRSEGAQEKYSGLIKQISPEGESGKLLYENLDQVIADLETVKTKGKDAGIEIDNLKELFIALEDAGDQIIGNKIKNAESKMLEEIAKAENDLKQLQEPDKNDKRYYSGKKGKKKFNQKLYDKDLEKYNKDLEENKKKLNEAKEKTKNFTNAIREESEAAADAGETIQRYNEETGEMDPGDLIEDSRGAADTILDLTQGVMGFVSAWQTLSGLKNIWSDEDMSFGEKLLTSLTSLGMVIPTVIQSYEALRNVAKKNELATIMDTAANWLNSKSLLGKAAAAEVAAAADTEEAVASGTATLANMGEAASNKAVTLSSIIATSAVGNLALAFMKLVAAAAPYIAIAAGIGAIIYSLYQAYNEHNIAVEEASNKVEKLSNLYNDLNSKASEFKNTVSNYDSAIKAIDELEKGTQEYYDAIQDANDKSKELIETYKLFDDYTIGTDGLIKIDENALNNIQKQLDSAVAEVEKDKYAAEIAKQGAISHQNIVELSRDKDYKYNKSITYTQNHGKNASFASYQTNTLDYSIKITSDNLENIGNSLLEFEKDTNRSGATLQDFAKALETGEISLDDYSDGNEDFALMVRAMADQGGIEFNNYIVSLREAEQANKYYAQQILGIEIEQNLGAQIQALAETTGLAYESILAFISGDEESAEKLGTELKDNSEKAKGLTFDLATQSGSEGNLEAIQLLKDYADIEDYQDKEAVMRAIAIRQGADANLIEYNKEKGIVDAKGEVLVGNNVSLDLLLTQLFTDILDKIETEKIASDSINNSESRLGTINTIGHSNAGNEYGTNFNQAAIDYLNATDRTGGMALDIGSLNQGQISELKGLTDTEILEMFGFGPGTKEIGDLTASQFIQGFREGLENNWSKEGYIANVRSKFKAEIEALDVDFNTDELEAYAQSLEKINPLLKDNYEASMSTAMAHLRLAEGTEELAKNWKDWNEVMSSDDQLAIAKIKDDIGVVLQDMLNLTPEQFSLLPDDFVEKHWDMLEEVINGTEGAMEELMELGGEEILLGTIKAKIDDQGILNQTLGLFSQLEAMTPPTIEVGTNVDQLQGEAARYVEILNAIIAACGLTSEEASRLLTGLGFNATFKEVKKKMTNYMDVPEVDELGNPTGNFITVPYEYEVNVPAVQIETLSSSFGGNINTASSVAASGAKAGGSSGGGGEEEEIDLSDYVTRYKELDDVMDDLLDNLEDINKQTDRLYGVNRIKGMEAQINLHKQEIGLLEKKKGAAEKYLEIDKQALLAAGSALGMNFTFDKWGNISNYTKEFNELGKQTLKGKDTKEKLDKLTEAINQYDETKELIEDIENKIDEAVYNIQDLNYEILTYTLEIEIVLNDMDLKRIDYYLNKIEDDFYGLAEGASLLFEKGQVIMDTLSEYEKFANGLFDVFSDVEDIDELFETARTLEKTTISQADYVEGLRDAYDEIYENLSELIEIDKKMLEYYTLALKNANEELEEHTDKFETLISALEHYKDINELFGKSTDNATVMKILNAQLSIMGNQLDVATNKYLMFVDQAQKAEAALTKAQNEEERKLLEENLKGVLEQRDAAMLEMLDATKAYGDKNREILEAELEDLAKTYEESLTRGLGFDKLNEQLERAVSLQEEFLTTTNKVYETTMLMKQAQAKLDSVSSEVAKEKLKAFMVETKQLQNQNRLSKFELEIQQAKYNLTVAQIALEDAKNAKSNVRLSRDSEGNFGYVYTADEESILKAEEDVMSAENDLYNIGLEGSQKYAEQYISLQQEAVQKVAALRREDYESEAAYQAAVAQTKEYYQQKLLETQQLYTIALETDNRVRADSYAVSFEDIIFSTDQWVNSTDQYLQMAGNSYDRWAENGENATERVKEALESTGATIDEMVDMSTDLTTTINDELIPALGDELDAIRQVTEAWAAERAEIQALIDKMEELNNKIREEVERQTYDDSYDPDVDKYDADDTVFNPGKGGSGGGVEPQDDGAVSPKHLTSFYVEENDANGNNTYKSQTSIGYKEDVTDKEIKDAAQTIANSNTAALENYYKTGQQTDVSVTTTLKNGSTFVATPDYEKYKQEKIKNIEKNTGRMGSQDAEASTGAYTGSWGPEGKYIKVHEKELILNKEDTKNMLAAVSHIRKIASSNPEVLDRKKNYEQQYYSNKSKIKEPYYNDIRNEARERERTLSSLNSLNKISYDANKQFAIATEAICKVAKRIDSQTSYQSLRSIESTKYSKNSNYQQEELLQNVKIEATFPDVTDRLEIEEAFNNLINTASQYANRKKITSF